MPSPGRAIRPGQRSGVPVEQCQYVRQRAYLDPDLPRRKRWGSICRAIRGCRHPIRDGHPDQNFAVQGTRPEKPGDLLPRPVLPNVNFLLGDNGSGKSTILRATALTACGPAVKESGLRDPALVRRMVESKRPKSRVNKPDKLTMLRSFADMRGAFILHPQDRAAKVVTQSRITVSARFDLEQYGFEVSDEAVWEQVGGFFFQPGK